MVDKEVIENQCISIRGYLQELYEAQDIDWHKFSQDNRSRRFVERVLKSVGQCVSRSVGQCVGVSVCQ